MPDSGRTTVGSGRMCKDKVDYEEVDVTPTANGGMHKEKSHYVHKDVSVSGAMQTTPNPPAQSACPTKTQGCDNDSSWGCMWLVWIILIFIIILIIVMAVFWACKPSFVTRECEDDSGGCELDLARAALYAFVITFFLVLIGCAIWWACRR